MNTIELEAVFVPTNRFRKGMDQQDIEDLADSIETNGLFHLPILRTPNILVSGARRFEAIKFLNEQKRAFHYLSTPVPAGMLPFASYDDLDEAGALAIELDENLKRINLSWQEEVQAIARLHNFRKSQDPNWTARATGKESGITKADRVSDRLVLAQNLHRPEIRGATSMKQAVKELKRSFERDFQTALRSQIPDIKTKHTLIEGSAFEEIERLEPGFTVIITDPPWGIGASAFGVNIRSNMVRHLYRDDPQTAIAAYSFLAEVGFHLAADQAHLYTFLAFSSFFPVADLMARAGWEVWPRPFIWYKHIGNIPKPDLGPRHDYDCILFANKGRRVVNSLSSDVIDCRPEVKTRHAAEKPEAVYQNLLARSADPGDRVLDPFCGSGPIFPAAEALGLIATGIDNDPDSIAICRERLQVE